MKEIDGEKNVRKNRINETGRKKFEYIKRKI